MKIKCSRCHEIISGRSKLETERKFDQHICKGLRDINKLPLELLGQIISNKLTEKEAWEIYDKQNQDIPITK